MAVRHLINEPFAPWRSAIESGHLGGGGGFVDEDKSFRIKSPLFLPQDLTGSGDVFPVLLGSVHALFLKGSLRWRKKREIADWLTFTFSFARRALSSASVLSGCSAMSALTRSVCGTRANVLCPPNLAGLTLPVSRLRLMNPPTVLKAKLYSSATSSRVKPASMSATTRSRRSSEYGFAIHHWPPCPSGNLESDSCPYGNHQLDSTFPANALAVALLWVGLPPLFLG